MVDLHWIYEMIQTLSYEKKESCLGKKIEEGF